MNIQPRSRWVGSIVGVAMAACTRMGDDGEASESAHTTGELVWANDPHQWVDVEQRRFELRISEKAAPADHLVTRRMSSWVERFDVVVRETFRRKSGAELVAPVPRARVALSPDVNANVRTVPACIGGTPPVIGLATDIPPLAFMRDRRQVIFATDACEEARNWTLQSGLDWFNALGGLQVRRDGSWFVVTDGASVTKRAGSVAIGALAPIVTVNAGLLTADLSEKSVAVIIAHELGHYYRAHNSTSVKERYDFWYDRDEHRPERPVPVEEQSRYHADYQRLLPVGLTVAGQRFHPRVARTLLNWAAKTRVAPGHPCARQHEHVRSLTPEIVRELASPLLTVLSPEARTAYLEMEPSMASCIEAVALTDAPRPDFESSFASKEMPRAWFEALSESALLAQAPKEETTAATTLAELVAILERTATRIDEGGAAFLKRLRENRIGFYTVEQEADDLAMELAARVGIAPDEVIEALTELMFAVEKQDPDVARHQGMTAKQCESLLRSNFRVEGNPAWVSLGAVTDPHHAVCYRLFNLSRERAAHTYRVDPAAFPSFSPPWNDVRASAEALLTNMPPSPKPAEPPPRPAPTGTAPSAPVPPPRPMPSSEAADAGQQDSAATSAAPSIDAAQSPVTPSGQESTASADPSMPKPASSALPAASSSSSAVGCSTSRPPRAGPSFGLVLLLAMTLMARRRARS